MVAQYHDNDIHYLFCRPHARDVILVISLCIYENACILFSMCLFLLLRFLFVFYCYCYYYCCCYCILIGFNLEKCYESLLTKEALTKSGYLFRFHFPWQALLSVPLIRAVVFIIYRYKRIWLKSVMTVCFPYQFRFWSFHPFFFQFFFPNGD